MGLETKPSITFTALIWFGMLMVAAGAIVGVLGLGGVVTFSAKYKDAEFSTTSLGCAMMMIGMVMALLVALKLPKGITVFAVQRQTWQDRVAANTGWLAVLAGGTVLLFVLSVLVH
jgi:hypothetical protein